MLPTRKDQIKSWTLQTFQWPTSWRWRPTRQLCHHQPQTQKWWPQGKAEAFCYSTLGLRIQYLSFRTKKRKLCLFSVCDSTTLCVILSQLSLSFSLFFLLSHGVTAGSDQSNTTTSRMIRHIDYYSNNYHWLTKTNKRMVRKSKVFQNKYIRQNLVILHLRGAADRLNGFQMDRKCLLWNSAIQVARECFGRPTWARPAHRQERGPGVGGMLIMERGEHVWQRERMENTCPISHLFTFACQTSARLKGEEAAGEATAKVELFKVYLFDEGAKSLIAFQTFWEERGNLGVIETQALVVRWSIEKELCVYTVVGRKGRPINRFTRQ